MCIEKSMSCSCGCNKAGFHFRDDVMTQEVIEALYCPECSPRIVPNPESMMRDNGWVISYNMEMAGFLGKRLPQNSITPEFLFDEGYCTWAGLYPADHSDSVTERRNLLRLAKIDRMRYFREFKKWSLERMDRLAREGWRKAGEHRDAARS